MPGRVLLSAHAVDLRQQLVHHPVARPPSVTLRRATCHAHGVQLVEEENARRSGTCLQV